jgi:glycosyltransferase involved in cell wall biosynthesis
MELSIILWIMAFIAAINITYYIYFAKFAFAKAELSSKSSQQPISIIVCAKNESQNLKNLVPLLLAQTYTDFEIILINDSSKDDTLDVMESFRDQDERIKLVNVIPNEFFWGNKKYALTLGIKKAKNDKLLFIDADCKPASDAWIDIMSSLYGEEKSIVLGYGGYIKQPGILNALIRFETVNAAMQYLSYAMHGNAYMGVGRNLGYTATQFYESSGFVKHMKILGGDDDLFINSAADKNNTSVSLDPDSFTYSIPKTSWSDWWTQKRRHINTASHYKRRHRWSLGLFFISQLLFFICAIVGMIDFQSWMLILGIVVLRYLINWIVVGKSLLKLQERGLILFYPFLELLLMGCQLGLFFSNKSRSPKEWK